MSKHGEHDVVERDGFVLFWNGWLSQWFPSNFVWDRVQYNCCEQFMMAEKARFFGDESALRNILASDSPREQKAIGRRVRGFDENRWNGVCRGIVYRGNMAKFSQNVRLEELLLATGEKEIVEASPVDRIWGIGLALDDARATDPKQWQGKNWLGIALMQVRRGLLNMQRDLDPYVEPALAEQLAARGGK